MNRRLRDRRTYVRKYGHAQTPITCAPPEPHGWIVVDEDLAGISPSALVAVDAG
jgi:hypothetical protein